MEVDTGANLKQVSDVLAVRELPSMAAVVTAVAQPFAQVAERFELPLLPMAIAAFASVLLAARNTWPAHGTPSELNAWVIAPLIALVLFATSLGANNIVSAWARPADSSSAQTLSAQLEKTSRQLQLANEQLAVKQKQIELQDQAITTLKRAAGIAGLDNGRAVKDRKAVSVSSNVVSSVLLFFSPAAQAQPVELRRPDATSSKRKAEEELRALEAQRQQLEQQQRKLAEEQRKLEATPVSPATQAEKNKTQLWRAW